MNLFLVFIGFLFQSNIFSLSIDDKLQSRNIEEASISNFINRKIEQKENIAISPTEKMENEYFLREGLKKEDYDNLKAIAKTDFKDANGESVKDIFEEAINYVNQYPLDGIPEKIRVLEKITPKKVKQILSEYKIIENKKIEKNSINLTSFDQLIKDSFKEKKDNEIAENNLLVSSPEVNKKTIEQPKIEQSKIEVPEEKIASGFGGNRLIRSRSNGTRRQKKGTTRSSSRARSSSRGRSSLRGRSSSKARSSFGGRKIAGAVKNKNSQSLILIPSVNNSANNIVKNDYNNSDFKANIDLELKDLTLNGLDLSDKLNDIKLIKADYDKQILKIKEKENDINNDTNLLKTEKDAKILILNNEKKKLEEDLKNIEEEKKIELQKEANLYKTKLNSYIEREAEKNKIDKDEILSDVTKKIEELRQERSKYNLNIDNNLNNKEENDFIKYRKIQRDSLFNKDEGVFDLIKGSVTINLTDNLNKFLAHFKNGSVIDCFLSSVIYGEKLILQDKKDFVDISFYQNMDINGSNLDKNIVKEIDGLIFNDNYEATDTGLNLVVDITKKINNLVKPIDAIGEILKKHTNNYNLSKILKNVIEIKLQEETSKIRSFDDLFNNINYYVKEYSKKTLYENFSELMTIFYNLGWSKDIIKEKRFNEINFISNLRIKLFAMKLTLISFLSQYYYNLNEQVKQDINELLKNYLTDNFSRFSNINIVKTFKKVKEYEIFKNLEDVIKNKFIILSEQYLIITQVIDLLMFAGSMDFTLDKIFEINNFIGKDSFGNEYKYASVVKKFKEENIVDEYLKDEENKGNSPAAITKIVEIIYKNSTEKISIKNKIFSDFDAKIEKNEKIKILDGGGQNKIIVNEKEIEFLYNFLVDNFILKSEDSNIFNNYKKFSDNFTINQFSINNRFFCGINLIPVFEIVKMQGYYKTSIIHKVINLARRIKDSNIIDIRKNKIKPFNYMANNQILYIFNLFNLHGKIDNDSIKKKIEEFNMMLEKIEKENNITDYKLSLSNALIMGTILTDIMNIIYINIESKGIDGENSQKGLVRSISLQIKEEVEKIIKKINALKIGIHFFDEVKKDIFNEPELNTNSFEERLIIYCNNERKEKRVNDEEYNK